MKHGFEQLNLHRIYCGTSVKNIAMQKLAAALGFVQEGIRRMPCSRMPNLSMSSSTDFCARSIRQSSMAGAPAQPPFPHLQYCTRCCIPETQEGVKFDDLGICQACQSSEQKSISTGWSGKNDYRRLLPMRRNGASSNYDCIIPISGGKDSTFQLHVLTKLYGMKPLAVTFSHNWWSETGWYNLQNALETFNVGPYDVHAQSCAHQQNCEAFHRRDR